MIGIIKFSNPNDDNLKEIFEKKIHLFITGLSTQNCQSVDYHDIDKNGQLSVVDYTEADNIEINNKPSRYHVLFKIIPPFNPTPGIPNHYRLEFKTNFSISQKKVSNKLFSAIKGKNEQHVNSKYVNKIYFLDSEAIPDFDFPIFATDSMFEEEKIKEYIDTFSENEIVCFVRREYMTDKPKVSIHAFGKNIDPTIKKTLEGLKTEFDYQFISNKIKHRY